MTFRVRSAEYARELAYLLDITPNEAYKIIDTIIKCLKEAVERKEYVFIRGFGTLKPVTYKAHSYKVPWHDYIDEAPERAWVKFLPSKELTYMINEGYNGD